MKAMKKTIMVLAMVCSAMCLNSCGGGDDDGGNTSSNATLTIDNESYCPNENSYIVESSRKIEIEANLANSISKRKIIELRVTSGPLVVSELTVGEVFSSSDLKVKDFTNGAEIRLYENTYTVESGNVIVESVNNTRVVLRFDNFTFHLKSSSNIFDEDYTPSNPKNHVLNGTVSFHNHLYKDGDWEPFY